MIKFNCHVKSENYALSLEKLSSRINNQFTMASNLISISNVWNFHGNKNTFDFQLGKAQIGLEFMTNFFFSFQEPYTDKSEL